MTISILAGIITLVFTTVLTIAGVGAAFILIPIFISLGVEVHEAMAVALLLNAIAMSVSSVRFVQNKLVVWKTALPILVVATALSPLGASTARGLDREVLLWMFVAFLLFAAAMMLFYQPKQRDVEPSTKRLLGYGISVGGAAGFLGGLLGVGGGNFIVPVLVWLGFDPKKASATTSFIVIFSSLSGFVGHATLGGIDWGLLGFTALGSAAGALGGSWLMTDKLKSRHVKLVIGVILLLIASKILRDLVK